MRGQQRACRKYAGRLGALVDAEYIDTGAGANDPRRPGLRALLARVKQQPQIDYVIVHRLDRLARALPDHLKIHQAIDESCATLVSCTETIDNTPHGKFQRGMANLVAEFYRRDGRSQQRRTRPGKTSTAVSPSSITVGYHTVVGTKGQEPEAAIVPADGPVVGRAVADTAQRAAVDGKREAA